MTDPYDGLYESDYEEYSTYLILQEVRQLAVMAKVEQRLPRLESEDLKPLKLKNQLKTHGEILKKVISSSTDTGISASKLLRLEEVLSERFSNCTSIVMQVDTLREEVLKLYSRMVKEELTAAQKADKALRLEFLKFMSNEGALALSSLEVGITMDPQIGAYHSLKHLSKILAFMAEVVPQSIDFQASVGELEVELESFLISLEFSAATA